MEKQKNKTITILLTRYSDLFSSFLYAISNRGYTHASLSLDEEDEFFYSFCYKGFCIERPKKRVSRKRKKGSACIRLQIQEKEYELLKKYVEEFIDNKGKYHYSRLGVILCLLQIPHKFKRHYFCSQFVAEMLSVISTIQLKKDASLYLPHDLMKELSMVSSQRQIAYDVI